jgi:hypothetical protein
MTNTTIMIRETERNWLEKLKRKHKLRSLSKVMEKIKNMFYKLKLEEEIR